MKIYVLPVPDRFRPEAAAFKYPKHNDDYGVEQDFHEYLLKEDALTVQSPDNADWHYLPVYWTRWHLNHDFAKSGVEELREEVSGADAATFQGLHYFNEKKEEVTHKWIYKPGLFTLADNLAGHKVPGASGNYMFTRESWKRAGGYPEFAGALDTWGFGFRQLATGSKMMVMEDSYYHHRCGHESYWVRFKNDHSPSLTALQIILPFIELMNERDVNRIMGRGRDTWFENTEKQPVRLKSGTGLLAKFNKLFGRPSRSSRRRRKR